MPLAEPQTTITVRQSTRKLLESIKPTGQTYDDLLRDLVDERYPPELVSELKRRMSARPHGRMDTEVYAGSKR